MLSAIEIKRPVGEIFSFLEDGNKTRSYICPEFQIKPVLQSPSQDGRYRLGTRVIAQGAFAGNIIKMLYRVVVFQPNRLVSLKSEGGKFYSEIHWRLLPQGENCTRVSLELCVKPGGGFGGFMSGMFLSHLEPTINTYLHQSLKRLKYILEQPVSVVA